MSEILIKIETSLDRIVHLHVGPNDPLVDLNLFWQATPSPDPVIFGEDFTFTNDDQLHTYYYGFRSFKSHLSINNFKYSIVP